jgi:hypothetical protein
VVRSEKVGNARDIRKDSHCGDAQWTPTSVARAALETPAFCQQFDEALRISFQTFERQVGALCGVTWKERTRNSPINGHFLAFKLETALQPALIAN